MILKVGNEKEFRVWRSQRPCIEQKNEKIEKKKKLDFRNVKKE